MFQDINKIFNSISNPTKGLYLIWLTIHLCIYFLSGNVLFKFNKYFYPFTSDSPYPFAQSKLNFLEFSSYDISEVFIYTILPILIYFSYKLLFPEISEKMKFKREEVKLKKLERYNSEIEKLSTRETREDEIFEITLILIVSTSELEIIFNLKDSYKIDEFLEDNKFAFYVSKQQNGTWLQNPKLKSLTLDERNIDTFKTFYTIRSILAPSYGWPSENKYEDKFLGLRFKLLESNTRNDIKNILMEYSFRAVGGNNIAACIASNEKSNKPYLVSEATVSDLFTIVNNYNSRLKKIKNQKSKYSRKIASNKTGI